MEIRARRFSRRSLLALGGVVLAYAAFGGAKCATIATLAIRNARIWTGTGERPIEGGTVAIYRDTIIAVGADDEVQLGHDTRMIDARGAFVMPGIIDTHVHVTEPLVRKEPLLPGWARAGVTTIRDTGTIWQGPGLLRTLAQDWQPRPRIIATGGLFTKPNGYPTQRATIGVAVAMQVGDAQAAVDAVNATADAGAEFIKVAVEDGLPGGRLQLHAEVPTFSVPEVRTIVDAAHARGLAVTTHVTNAWELRTALDGGVDSLAHTILDPIPDDLLARITGRRIPMSSTCNIWDGGPLAATAQANMKRVLSGGGVVAMGTDYPYQLHDGLPIGELRMMAATLTNEQILLACTRDAAVMCGRRDIGTLEAGRIADLLIVAGDPLARLDDLLSVTGVFQSGVQIL